MTMVISPQRNVKIHEFGVIHARFSRVTAHRLNISGLAPPCSGTRTYRWAITKGMPGSGHAQLKLTKIHDACKSRFDLFAGTWRFWKRT